ncbi:hypothetical protein F2Q69_00042832 [Brassica cretica]|uniref:Uncharacterized protein n=1 Tax=Brassica cretica TaxID=69181 RepID=A0A8S9N8F9_BRACR|nr:hypothetical protein F2Q69_00042832 [Brassica cretica]
MRSPNLIAFHSLKSEKTTYDRPIQPLIPPNLRNLRNLRNLPNLPSHSLEPLARSSRVDGAQRPARWMAELDRPHDQRGGWPSWIDYATSSADGRAGSTTRPPWPRDQLGHATSSAIRRAEPVRQAELVQFGGWPSWIDHATSLAIRQAETVQLGGWPSWNDHVTCSAIRRAGLTTRQARPSAELDYSSSEDKCDVSKDKHDDQRKMEYSREAINSTKGRKEKRKPPLGGVYKDVEVEEARGQYFYS